MPFKIVQTVEKDKRLLVVVPSSWEENQILWWPTKKTQYKLVKDEYSTANKTDWKQLRCDVKRQGIRTYQLAEAELSIMEENSDTDVNDAGNVSNLRRATAVRDEDTIKFELMANKLISGSVNQEHPSEKTIATENTTEDENMIEIINADSINYDQVLANQKVLSDKLDSILSIQSMNITNQQKILQKLAAQSVQIEELSERLTDITASQSVTNVTMLKDAKPEESESFSLRPINCQQDLINLDQLLTNKAEKKKLQKQLSFLCSVSTGEGITCAYKLQEILFTRDFLCNCSWSGGSRGETSKIAIKDYKNVLKFFYGMVRTWDPTYSEQQNECFFKIITKNSKQRKFMKNLRTSSQRNRKTKKNTKKQDDSEEKSKKTENEETALQEGQEVSMVVDSGKQDEEKENNKTASNILSDDNTGDDLC